MDGDPVAAPDGPERPPLTVRRLFGLDRSGPPPAATLSDAPWNVWTIPNAIGFVRLALLVPFLILALSSESGTDALPAVLFAIVGWSDYADGIAARVTGQFSRFGALLDPVVDRLLVVCGLVVCWKFELLPRWGIAVLLAREVYLLVAGRLAMQRGVELTINWWGRAGVWPTMSAIFLALVGLEDAAAIFLYVGLFLSLMAAAQYTRDALAQWRGRPSS